MGLMGANAPRLNDTSAQPLVHVPSGKSSVEGNTSLEHSDPYSAIRSLSDIISHFARSAICCITKRRLFLSRRSNKRMRIAKAIVHSKGTLRYSAEAT